MKFGEFDVTDAEGLVLAHRVKVAGRTFKKGRVLSEQDIDALLGAGVNQIIGARIEPSDVAEDQAAESCARVLAGSGVRVAAPFTGRCNLFASGAGLLTVDAASVDAVNAVDESLTVATLAAPRTVRAGEMLATVKVIPFAVDAAVLEAARARAQVSGGAITVTEFSPMSVAVVQTRLSGTRESVLDKTSRVLGARIRALEGDVVDERRCPHAADAVAEAIAGALDRGADMVLVVGASAIVDRRDVIPAGLVLAGGEILHFGMPVDPGNLLLLGRCRERPVLGLPGCARSPKYNGLDQVLERLAARLPVRSADIMAMGVGGLLTETAERAQPRGGPRATAGSAPKVAALVLAAGRSTRMGSSNKLLARIGGRTMVRGVVEALASAAVDRVVVVTGHESDRIHAALDGLDVTLTHNAQYRDGLSASLQVGLAAIGDDADAIVVGLGDMPLVTSTHVNRLISAFDPVEGREICVPTFEGKRGNPVLFGRRFIPEMNLVRGDVGARHLIGAHEDVICEVAMDDASVLVDVDSPEALERLKTSA